MARHLPRLLLLWLFVSQGSAWALVEHITTYQYDDFDRLISVTDAHDKTLRYGYDLNGNRTQLTDADGKITLNTFDELNRTTSVKTQAGTTTYTYDKSGLLTQTRYPNNTKEATEYDSAKRIRNITNTQNSAVVSQYDYQYDSNGNRTRQIEINGGAAQTTAYTYDTLDRLSSVVYPDNTTTYTYDANYNRLTETVTGSTPKSLTYSYNARNQLTRISDALNAANNISYSFDDNGNQISKTQGSDVQTFTYDARNHLRAISATGAQQTTPVTFMYNSEGLRIEKQGERGTERYTYDDNSLLQEYDSSNTTLAKYDYGAHKLISLIHHTEPTQYYLTDALNSVVDLTNTNGLVQARYQYDAFGNKRAESGTSANRFAFTGYTEDRETNLLYAKARYYDSDTGRFLSQDAWEGETDTPPSLHKYLYAYQNPTVWVDPTGNAPLTLEAKEAAFEAAEMHMDEAKREDNYLGATLKAVLAGTELLLWGILAGGDFAANNVISASKAYMDPQIVHEAEQERDKAFGAVQAVVENPKGFASTAADSVSSNVEGMIKGDVSSYVNVVATATSFVGGGKPNISAGQAVHGASQATGRVVNTAVQVGRGAEKFVMDLAEGSGSKAGKSVAARESISALTDAEAGMTYSHPVGEVAKGVTFENKALTTYHPPNNGALGESAPLSLLPGTRIDRYGRDAGRYLSPEGTPMEMRALAPTDAPRAYSIFEVRTPFTVEASTISPAYGQTGLGLQFYTDRSISDLLRGGYLTRVHP